MRSKRASLSKQQQLSSLPSPHSKLQRETLAVVVAALLLILYSEFEKKQRKMPMEDDRHEQEVLRHLDDEEYVQQARKDFVEKRNVVMRSSRSGKQSTAFSDPSLIEALPKVKDNERLKKHVAMLQRENREDDLNRLAVELKLHHTAPQKHPAPECMIPRVSYDDVTAYVPEVPENPRDFVDLCASDDETERPFDVGRCASDNRMEQRRDCVDLCANDDKTELSLNFVDLCASDDERELPAGNSKVAVKEGKDGNDDMNNEAKGHVDDDASLHLKPAANNVEEGKDGNADMNNEAKGYVDNDASLPLKPVSNDVEEGKDGNDDVNNEAKGHVGDDASLPLKPAANDVKDDETELSRIFVDMCASDDETELPVGNSKAAVKEGKDRNIDMNNEAKWHVYEDASLPLKPNANDNTGDATPGASEDTESADPSIDLYDSSDSEDEHHLATIHEDHELDM